MPATSNKRSAAQSPVQAFLAALGVKAPPEVVKVHVRFSAPKQGAYQPPHYELVIDSTAGEWCTYRNYNQAPRPIDPMRVQVPIEMTRCTVVSISPGLPRAKVSAWAKSLLRCG